MTFTARFESICTTCHKIIHPGDEIVWDGDSYSHAICESDQPEQDRPVCTRCWQMVAVNGACGCDQT